jgi:hypothetical protein
MEPLEPRLLLSASLDGGALAGPGAGIYTTQGVQIGEEVPIGSLVELQTNVWGR